MTAVAHYLPENAAEAELAAQIVAADFHAKDVTLLVSAFLRMPSYSSILLMLAMDIGRLQSMAHGGI
jgi:hypothetical protein